MSELLSEFLELSLNQTKPGCYFFKQLEVGLDRDENQIKVIDRRVVHSLLPIDGGTT